MFLLSVRLKNDLHSGEQMLPQHFIKVQQSVKLRIKCLFFFPHHTCCQERTCTGTSQPVELSIRVPELEEAIS